MYTHPCIKCRQQYDTEDVDAYYCQTCDEERKAIAAQIDAKTVKPKREIVSALQEYDAAQKVHGFVQVRL